MSRAASSLTPNAREIPEPQPSCSGAQAVVRVLEAEGVDVVFAYPGAATMPLHQALLGSRIRTVLPRHEQGGAFAAEGYARAGGRVGVCIATSGPGATNLLTGIADAYMDSVPMIAIAGQVARHLIGKRAFQGVDVADMAAPVVKRSYRVGHAADIPAIMREAFATARGGRPGPVLIELPRDVQVETLASDGDASTVGHRDPLPQTTEEPGRPSAELDAPVRTILARLARARRPVILAGGGVIAADATGELRRFAERTGIPVATTLMGCGAFPEDHELSLRWVGMHGAAFANWAVHHADLLIAVGARFSDRVTGRVDRFCAKAFIVHIDIDAEELGRNKEPHLALRADARAALAALNQGLETKRVGETPTSWRERIATWQTDAPFRCGGQHAAGHDRHLIAVDGVGVLPSHVIETLDRLTGGEAIITTGVGQHQMWAAQFFRFRRPRQLVTSAGLGSMGFGLPAAIGAKLACPSRQVIDIDGDGSFLMNIQELATARVEDVAVKAVVLNNQHLGMVFQHETHVFEGRHAHTYLGDPRRPEQPFPDFPTIVRGFGIDCERVSQAEQLEPALERMLAATRPYVVEVMIPACAEVRPFMKAGTSVEEMLV